jgi:arylsulfatase
MLGAREDGGSASLTPNLDRFARKSIVFKTAIAQGFRTPISMPSLFTGKSPHKLTLSSIQSPFGLKHRFRCLLLGEEPTIAQVLERHGYQTAGIHSNPLLTSYFGYHKGFQYFYEDLFLKNAALPSSVKRWLMRFPHFFRSSPYLPAESLNKKALSWLDQAKDPFFLWLHYMDAHGPYQSKKGLRYVNKIRADLLYRKATGNPKAITDEECQRLYEWYKEEVAYLDREIGKLFECLERKGRMENTLVILTADHGEEFREHGRLTHHSTLYEEVLHVPAIFKLPHADRGGWMVDKPIGLVQVFPTILDFLGIQTDIRFDGKSLFPLIDKNDERSLPDYVLSHGKFAPKPRISIRNEEWKLIVDDSLPKGELYHLKTDPGEHSNVVDNHPDITSKLTQELKRRVAGPSNGSRSAGWAKKEVDGEILQRLKELGYL